MADEIQKEEAKERTFAIYQHPLVLGVGLFTFFPRRFQLGVVFLQCFQLRLDVSSALDLYQGKLHKNIDKLIH